MRAFFKNIIDYMSMYNKNRKYMYYEDKFGAMLCYIDSNQPTGEDTVFITIIAERSVNPDGMPGKWDVSQRNTPLAIDLKKVTKKEFYEDYEEFCEKYWEAIL
jgi:hypothetical protein